MSRSTIKQQNILLDQIKVDTGLKSRKSALEFLYSKIAPSFKKKGYSLSHYKDGCFQITKDHFHYFTINHNDLYTPLSTIIAIERTETKFDDYGPPLFIPILGDNDV